MVCVSLGEMLEGKGFEVSYIVGPYEGNKHIKENVFPIKSPLFHKPAISANLPLDKWAFKHGTELLKKLRPDIVHFVAKRLFPSLMKACTKLHIPTAYTVVDQYLICPKENLRKRDGSTCNEYHGWNCGSCMRYDSGGWLLQDLTFLGGGYLASLIRAWYLDQLARRLTAIVTLSDISRQRMLDYGFAPDRVHTIYHYHVKVPEVNGVCGLSSKPTVLYAGSLHEVRGPQVAIQAMALVARELPDAVLNIAGPDSPVKPFLPVLEELVRKLNLKRNVNFLGPLQNREVLKLVRKSGVVVVPLQWPNEFGPVILVEALALAKPVVASRIGATSEFVKDNDSGFLVSPDKPEEFAERILFLLRNREKADEMGKRGAASVTYLRDGSMIDNMITLYRKCIALCKTV